MGTSSIITISSEENVIGSKSLKLSKPANVSYYASINFEYTVNSSWIGETLNISCYIKTSHQCLSQIYVDDEYLTNIVSVPATDEFILISSSFVLPESETLSFRFMYNPTKVSDAATLFMDDFEVKIS